MAAQSGERWIRLSVKTLAPLQLIAQRASKKTHIQSHAGVRSTRE
jgi:hypothetical protein